MATKTRVTSREWTLTVEGGPPTTGTTSGLKTVTVKPERMEITEFESGTVRATLTGPRVRADGTVLQAYGTVKVLVSQLDGSTMRYEPAPEWVSEVYRKVST